MRAANRKPDLVGREQDVVSAHVKVQQRIALHCSGCTRLQFGQSRKISCAPVIETDSLLRRGLDQTLPAADPVRQPLTRCRNLTLVEWRRSQTCRELRETVDHSLQFVQPPGLGRVHARDFVENEHNPADISIVEYPAQSRVGRSSGSDATMCASRRWNDGESALGMGPTALTNTPGLFASTSRAATPGETPLGCVCQATTRAPAQVSNACRTRSGTSTHSSRTPSAGAGGTVMPDRQCGRRPVAAYRGTCQDPRDRVCHERRVVDFNPKAPARNAMPLGARQIALNDISAVRGVAQQMIKSSLASEAKDSRVFVSSLA